MNGVADYIVSGIGSGFYEAAKKGSQVQDVVFSIRLALERGLDTHSGASVSQADLLKFYDNLDPLRVAAFLEHVVSTGSEQPGTSIVDVTTTLVCMHVLPTVQLSVGDSNATMPDRRLGMLTGSASAAASGRLPPADLALNRMPIWQTLHLGLETVPGGPGLCLMTFVDNFVTLGPDARTNAVLLEDAELYLKKNWGLQYGHDSRQCLPCKGAPPATFPSDPERWPVRDTMKCLGCIFQRSGRSNRCVQDALDRAHRAVMLNLGKGLLQAGRPAKAKFLKTCVRSILSWRWASWPYLAHTAKVLEGFQRDLCSLLWRVTPQPGESYLAAMTRQHSDSKLVARELGDWSDSWAVGVAGWHNHVVRNTASSFCLPLLRWNGQSWIQQQRQNFEDMFPSLASTARTITRTRLTQGRPPKRWQACAERAGEIAVAMGYEPLLPTT